MTVAVQRLSSSWWSILDQNKHCRGHVLNRGRSGYEAFDRDDKSLGRFENLRAAADAVLTGGSS